MKKKLFAGLVVGVMCCTVAVAAACSDDDGNKTNSPKKLGDGISIVLDEGQSTTVDLSLYISVEGTDYSYSVVSSAETVATVSVSANIATVTAVSEGTATVTASAGEISVEFPVTVNGGSTSGTADKTALQAEIDKAITEQGDYTEASYNEYKAKLDAAKAVAADAEATKEQIDGALADLKTATNALELREPTEVSGAQRQLDVVSGANKEITIADYVDDAALSKITYAVTADKNVLTVSEIKDGKFTLTANGVEADTVVTVTIKVSYDGKEALSSKIIVTVKHVVDKTELKTAIDGALSAQGDYTAESYAVYTEKLELAREVFANEEATQAQVNTAVAELKAAFDALAVRTPVEVQDAVKSFKLLAGLDKEITIADYIDEDDISGITYEATSDSDKLTVGAIAGGKFTVTAESVEAETQAVLSIVAKYNGETALTVTINFTITNDIAPVTKEGEVVVVKDLYTEENKTDITIDFAANIENPGELDLEYIVTLGDDETPLTLDGTSYTYEYDSLTDEETLVAFHVTVKFTVNELPSELEYNYILNLRNTTAYRVENGSFTDYTDGWTQTGEIGVISEVENDTFWADGFPIFNVGNYFRGDSKEGETGKLSSSLFTVGGQNNITFMLGAAGNKECYITLEDENGRVLEVWRNTKFNDDKVGEMGGWQFDQVGKTQFALNLVTYVADLSAYDGQRVRVVLNDNATGGFGFFTFDELVTYYSEVDEIPEGAILAVNELANKQNLATALENVITEQGDYTEASYNAYREKVKKATAVFDNIGATQADVDAVITELETATNALELRQIEVVGGAETSFVLVSEGVKDIDFAAYIDTKNLSNVTISVTSANEQLITVAETEAGKYTLTAAAYTDTEATTVKVTLSATYKDGTPVTVELNITVKSDAVPEFKKDTVVNAVDIYGLTDKNKITLDFAENVISNGVAFTVSATLNGEAVSLDENGCLEYAFGVDETYGETALTREYTVTITYDTDQTIQYPYTLSIKDTTGYRIVNGGFETGDLTGWTLTEGEIPGRVGSDTKYFANVEYGKDGNYLFTAICGHSSDNDPTPDGLEGKKGTIRSEKFILKANGWISFKLGGAINPETGIRVYKADGTLLAQFRNTNNAPQEGKLIQYIYQFTDLTEDTECYIEIFDNADSGWGLVAVDSIETYYESAPELTDAVQATDVKTV